MRRSISRVPSSRRRGRLSGNSGAAKKHSPMQSRPPKHRAPCRLRLCRVPLPVRPPASLWSPPPRPPSAASGRSAEREESGSAVPILGILSRVKSAVIDGTRKAECSKNSGSGDGSKSGSKGKGGHTSSRCKHLQPRSMPFRTFCRKAWDRYQSSAGETDPWGMRPIIRTKITFS